MSRKKDQETEKARPRKGKTSRLPLQRSKYQIFPPHPPARREALKTSIIQNGVKNATVWDDQGNLLDGWERESICQELGTFCHREVTEFKSEAEKFQFILAVNAARRPSLSTKQKREVIAGYLKGDPVVADNTLAEDLGVSKNTVLEERKRLEETGEIPKVEMTRGKDGKSRPVRYAKRIITNSPKEFEKAKEIIQDLPDNCAGKTLDITTGSRRAARNRNKEKRECSIVQPLPDDAIRLYHCPFQELEQIADIKPGTVQLVLTDIPYGQAFLPHLADLGRFAERVLVEGGLFVSVCGQYWLNKVMKTMSRFLTYRWVNASVWDGDATPVHIGGWKEPHGRVLSKWKPIIIYSKGGFPKRGQWCDVSHINSKEKEWHPWQQPLAEVEMHVRYFSNPGDLVVDPCGGGFTAAEACLRQSRRFVGCDSEAECVSKGQERLELATNSMTLGA